MECNSTQPVRIAILLIIHDHTLPNYTTSRPHSLTLYYSMCTQDLPRWRRLRLLFGSEGAGEPGQLLAAIVLVMDLVCHVLQVLHVSSVAVYNTSGYIHWPPLVGGGGY